MSTIKLRRSVNPLSVSCTVFAKASNKVNTDSGLVGVGYCPLTQTYDVGKESYEVSRMDYPTVIVPRVRLYSTIDNVSFDNSSSRFTNIKWYAQRNDWSEGKDISTIDEWVGFFTITATGIEKGSIKITKDVPSDVTWTLWMSGQFDDNRSGSTTIVDIISEKVSLKTDVNSESLYTLVTNVTDGDVYDMLLDKRIEYDYKVAKGIIPSTTQFVDDGKTYLKDITLKLLKGGQTLVYGTDYTYVIELIENGSNTIMTTENEEIHSLSENNVVFDLRRRSNATFKVSAVVNEKTVAQVHYGYAYAKTKPDYEIFGGGTFSSVSKVQAFEVECTYNNEVIEYPEAYLDINWYSKRQNGTSTQRGGGERVELDMTSSSVIQSSDNSLEISLELNKRGILMNLTDENEDTLIVEGGEGEEVTLTIN